MKLKTTLNGQTFAFRDIRDVLAKANEPKAADRLQGVAAETVTAVSYTHLTLPTTSIV